MSDQEKGTQNAVEVFIGNKGFYRNTLCSNDKLQCGCAKQHHTECYQGRVYWYDSCGNRENVYDANKAKSYNNGFVLPVASSCTAKANDPKCGNCDYSHGTLCGQAPLDINPSFGDLACIDLNCENAYDDKISPNAGGDKKHGESWCIYDKFPGNGRDRPGARHYRHLCIAGEEMVEPCADFRDQICIQGVIGKEIFETQASFNLQKGFDYVEAACRKNRFEQCSKFTKKSDCENVAYSDCYWTESGIINMSKTIETIGISGELETTPPGNCVPLVPPGLKFWPDEETINMGRETPIGQQSATGKSPDLDAKAACSKATNECIVMFEDRPLRGISKKCIKNCHCLQEDWIIAGYNSCTAQGDCGAKYNILDKVSLSGLEVIDEKNSRKFTLDMLGRTATAKAGKSAEEPSMMHRMDDSKLWAGLLGIAASGLIQGLSSKGGGFDAGLEKAIYGPKLLLGELSSLQDLFGGEKKPPKAGSVDASVVAIDSITGDSILDVTGIAIKSDSDNGIWKIEGTNYKIDKNILMKQNKDKTWQEIKLTEEQLKQLNIPQEQINDMLGKTQPETEEEPSLLSELGTVSGVLNILSWAYSIYATADIATMKFNTYKVAVICNPWVAPLGGKDCEKCNDKFKPCSEYKCRSLGQTCRLVNPGTDDEKCINLHPNDVNSPIITPNLAVLTKGYSIKDSGPNQGFELTQKIDPYSPLRIGINTNEPATCKYSTNASMKFDDMPFVFGSPLFLYNQTMIISLPRELASEEALKQTHGIYTLYLKCMDASGNKNNKDYFIKLKIKPEKDLTPPIIEAASLKDNAYIAANIEQTEFSIFTNEPATCKYSSNDVQYDDMKNDFSCSESGFQTSSVFYATYGCKTTLKDLKEGSNIFYFRCNDMSNNKNQESFKFTLIGTKPLLINETLPQGDVMSNNVTLEVTTVDGAENGKAVCGYRTGSSPDIEFSATNSNHHVESLTLNTGTYNYLITCNDIAGNEAKATISFKITKDLTPPKLMFVYKDSATNILHIELNEMTTCEYSTISSFNFGDGTKMTNENANIHEASLVEDSNKFYITCQDIFKNEYDFIVYP